MASKAHATTKHEDETPLTGVQKDAKHVQAVQRIKALTATLRDPERTHEQDVAVADQIDKELNSL